MRKCLLGLILLYCLLTASAAHAQESPFRAGAAISNITPPLGNDIIGGFAPFPATHVHDELYARCLVLDDGAVKLVFVVCDILGLDRLVQVLVYTSDDPIMARRLKAAGAASVMPAGSPIGSGQGVLNPNNIRIILEYLKENDPDYPVIVDAGVGIARTSPSPWSSAATASSSTPASPTPRTPCAWRTR